MIVSLKGIVQELSPTHAVIDVGGVGYYLGLSLQTSQKLSIGKEYFIHTQQIFREDAHLLFGFAAVEEKEVFNLLTSVSGVGASSALLLLSYLEVKDIANAILNADSITLKKVKGIGSKTADRIVVDLRDKMQKYSIEGHHYDGVLGNKSKEEALSALEVLGISRKISEKHIDKLLKTDPSMEVEALVRQILRSV